MRSGNFGRVQGVFPPPRLPAIADNNALFNDEGDSTAGWVNHTGTPSITTNGTEVIMNGAAVAMRKVTGVSVASNDFLVYFKLRVQRGAGRFAGFNLNSDTNVLLSINFGYNWVTGAAVDGTISVNGNAGATKKVLATSDPYDTTPPEFLIHVDRNRSAIMIYRKISGRWKFLTNVTYWSGITGITRVVIDNSATATEAGLDYVTIARPNVIAIGDSICAGANGFDPNPATYAGDDNNDSTWQQWATIYPSLRNNFIVNKGIGSQSSAQLLARITEATAHSPRLVMIHASSNDYSLGLSQSSRTTNIQSTVNAVLAASAKAVLMNAVYARTGHAQHPALGNYMRDSWDNYLPAITGLTTKIDTMVPLVDPATGFMAAALTDADSIHPNISGYTALGQYVATFQ